MTSRYLDVTNDLAFKKTFSDKGIMKDFLNSILHLSDTSSIEEIEFIPSEEVPDLGQGKRSIFDLKCKDQSGNWFVVEMQNRKQPYFLNRMQFYASHTYVSQLPKGKDHAGLMPVILIAITKENIFPDDIGCISFHKTKEDLTNKQHLFALSYVFVELAKFDKQPQELTSAQDFWLYFLSNSQEAKEPPSTIDDPFVLKAYNSIERFNWTDAEYDGYIRARLLAEAEELSLREKLQKAKTEGIAEGEAAGMRQGIQKGKIEAAEKIARSMLAAGIDKATVSACTGLPIQKIEKL